MLALTYKKLILIQIGIKKSTNLNTIEMSSFLFE